MTRWVVPAFYPEYFELMCAYLPQEQWEGIRSFVILTPEANRETIAGTIQKYIPQWETSIYSFEFIDSFFPDIPPTLKTYELRMKMFVNHAFQSEAILYTDDDVVVTKDPTPLLGDKAWWSFVHTDGFYMTNKQDVRDVLALEETFEIGLDTVHFNRTRTDGGMWYLPEDTDLSGYYDLLVAYFSHPHNVSIMQNMTVRRRYRDQRFLSVYFDLYADGAPLKGAIKTWNGPFDRRSPKGWPTQTFLHYACGRHKPDYVRYLWEQLQR